MTLKQKIHKHYLQLVQDKIDVFRDMIANLADDAQNDAKGSAGDKHETALSMMHIEQEKLTHKLKENLGMKAVLEKIDPTIISGKIALGSLVKANGIHLFVSGALPKIKVDDVTVIALSPQSPLGSKLLCADEGFSFEIQSTVYNIESVF
jgi:hypothetical protein